MGDGRDGEGKKRLSAKTRKYWMAIAFFSLSIVIFAVLQNEFTLDSPVKIQQAIEIKKSLSVESSIFIAIFVFMILSSSCYYFYKIADEQEKNAQIWSGFIGFVAVIDTIIVWKILSFSGFLGPVDAIKCTLIGSIVALLAYFWKKYL